MTIHTKFQPGDRVASVAKVTGVWQSGLGTVTSITITIPGNTSYLIDADSGPDVTRQEAFTFYTLAEATAFAAALNA